MLLGIAASAILCGLYAHGGWAWLLGFAALVPWLITLDRSHSLGKTLLSAYLMSVAYTLSVFAWFGTAIGAYTQVGQGLGLLALLLGAPVFQPQILALALARHLTARRHGPVLQALAGTAAWVATERLVPKLLGDTLGYGLYPSVWMRQAAELIGAAGLTTLLLLSNETIRAAWTQRQHVWVPAWKPLAFSALIPAALAAFGWFNLQDTAPSNAPTLRLGLVQTNLVDYERMRQEKGAYAVVREALNTHYAMSYDAVERQHVDAVLWSETVYPTPFGHPKSQVGAEFDQEILSVMRSAGVPFVFGTYDLDDQGEYNAAAFVSPRNGLLGLYRKSRPFPMTEYVPSWLDGPTFRQLFPWTGTWKPGNGARVFPLQLKDGREIPVVPLICLDDVDTGLALAGTRLGAQAILTMSNDSWFTEHPQGAALHQAVAAFRSIETGLPQFRVTNNGYSAIIDKHGNVIASARMGERTLVIGALPVPAPSPTLMVRWGDWVGLVCAAFLSLLGVTALLPKWHPHAHLTERPQFDWQHQAAPVTLLPTPARLAAGLLRSFARVALVWLAFAMLLDDALRTNTLAQIRLFGALCLAPEAAAWFLMKAFAAQAQIHDGHLVLSKGRRHMRLPLSDIAATELWWLPMPSPGLSIRLRSGPRWRYGLAMPVPAMLAQALSAHGSLNESAQAPVLLPSMRAKPLLTLFTSAREAMRQGRMSHPWVKFGLFPLVLALPAFRLHQHIAYGSTFGEYYTFGLKAYLTTLLLWWATWAIGVATSAALLRVGVEAITLMAALLRPQQAIDTRYLIERMALVALYLGMPIWLVVRMTGNN